MVRELLLLYGSLVLLDIAPCAADNVDDGGAPADVDARAESAQASEAAIQAQRNLEHCLNGDFGSVCNHSMLTPEQARLVSDEEARRNFNLCLYGTPTSRCDWSMLSPEQAEQVRVAKAPPNFNLPECPSTRNAKPIRRASESMFGKKVALRGVLTFGGYWVCECDCESLWRVVEAGVDVLSGHAPELLIRLHEQRDLWRFVVRYPKREQSPPDLDVVASGILRAAERRSAYYDDFLLEDAQICRVRADPRHPIKPLTHPPRSGIDFLVGCDL